MAKKTLRVKKLINLNPETHRKLRIYAAKSDRTMMDIMGEALDDFLEKKNTTKVAKEADNA